MAELQRQAQRPSRAAAINLHKSEHDQNGKCLRDGVEARGRTYRQSTAVANSVFATSTRRLMDY